MSCPIPVYTSLADVYDSLGSSLGHAERWSDLARRFQERFGKPPAYIVRAPGRVNLIGEHIDYSLFGVIPTAIEHDILIACAPALSSRGTEAIPRTSGAVVAENLADEYEPSVFVPLLRDTNGETEWDLQIDKKALRWDSYVKAGYYGVLNRYFPPADTSIHASEPVPVDLMVTGTVPPGAGLSSSAAVVVSSTLAFLAVNGILEDPVRAPSKVELVEMAMENERRVGVNSGGMDQAASVISQAGSALYVSFFPKLSTQTIPLPGTSSCSSSKSAAFVIAHTLVPSPKALHAKTHYNLRVIESAVAARVLAHRLRLLSTGPDGVGADRWKRMGMGGHAERISLRGVLEALVDREFGSSNEGTEEEDVDKLRKGLERMIEEVECLRPVPGTGVGDRECDGEEPELGVDLETMIKWTGMDRQKFEEVYLDWLEVEADRFQLYKRAKHCYEESLRVLQFRDICLTASSASTPCSDGACTPTSTPCSYAQLWGTSDAKAASDACSVAHLMALGTLMNHSQASCSALYECTCPEIDLLTRLAREAGAYGSRVTGAGWGGCTVSLVDESRVESFISHLRETYPPYRDLLASKEKEEAEGVLRSAIFATKPSSGVCVYKFTD